MKNLEIKLACIFIFFAGAFFMLFAVYSEGDWGGADSMVHYRISRYAFKYPGLFLDLWGKPVFNILSSPFSQLGFLGLKFFNVCVALVSSWIAFSLTRIMKWPLNYLAIPMVLFAPMYFIIIPSGLTEPLFGLVLISAVWLFFKDKYVLSAVIISLLPFARNEGFIIIPFFFLAFLLRKTYKPIPFLISGYVFFSLLGWLIFKDIFWISKHFFGPDASQIYGSGKLLHFVNEIDDILGFPLLVFWLAGFIFSLAALFKNGTKISHEHYFFLLVVCPPLFYFVAHSVVWWLGMGGSLGLTRVIGGVLPLAALVSFRGIYEVYKWLSKNAYLAVAFVFACLFLIVYYPFTRFDVPIRIGEAEKLIKEACNWLKDEGLDEKLIYYYDPSIPFYLDKDPYDKRSVHELVPDREHPENGMPADAVVFWDAHFGPNEGQLPLERLMKNEAFEFIKKIAPEHPFETLNGYTYEIYLFRRK